MSITDTDWKTFLSPDSDYPPDVSFLVTDGEDNRSTKNIRAHKGLLAGVSPVFRKQFFGEMKDEREEIEVENTTAEAFQVMVDFIYRPPGQDIFIMNIQDCPQKHFEVLELAERYQIWALKALVKESLQNFVVTRENMIFAATALCGYPHVKMSIRHLSQTFTTFPFCSSRIIRLVQKNQKVLMGLRSFRPAGVLWRRQFHQNGNFVPGAQ